MQEMRLYPDSSQRTSPAMIYRRLANFLILTLLVAIGATVWLNNQQQYNQLNKNQMDQLGLSLIQQVSEVISNRMVNQDIDSARQVLLSLYNDANVTSVSLHDEKARELFSQGPQGSFLSFYQQSTDKLPLVYVEDIIHQGKLIGYLRLVLDRDHAEKYLLQLQSNYQQQAKILLLVGVILGIAITRFFYVNRIKSISKKHRQELEKYKL